MGFDIRCTCGRCAISLRPAFPQLRSHNPCIGFPNSRLRIFLRFLQATIQSRLSYIGSEAYSRLYACAHPTLLQVQVDVSRSLRAHPNPRSFLLWWRILLPRRETARPNLPRPLLRTIFSRAKMCSKALFTVLVPAPEDPVTATTG